MPFHTRSRTYDSAVRSGLFSNAAPPLAGYSVLMPTSAWAMAGLCLLFTASGLVYLRKFSTNACTDPEETVFWDHSSTTSGSTSPVPYSPVTPPAAIAPHQVAQDRGTKLEDEHGISSSMPRYTSVLTIKTDAEKACGKLPVGMSRTDTFEISGGCRRHTIIIQ